MGTQSSLPPKPIRALMGLSIYIPHICHGCHGCNRVNFFGQFDRFYAKSGVFYRFNAKNWRFSV